MNKDICVPPWIIFLVGPNLPSVEINPIVVISNMYLDKDFLKILF